MMDGRCQSLPVDVHRAAYMNHRWFILTGDKVPRVDSRRSSAKLAERGELFTYELCSTDSLQNGSKKGFSSKQIMVSVNSSKVKVEWSENHFAPLTDQEKELLLAISSTRQRYTVYKDQRNYLSFGSNLKVGDTVQVCKSALKKKDKDAFGDVRYKGSMKGSSAPNGGTWFGIQLSTPDGTCNGNNYFCCRNNYGIFVSIDQLVPWKKPDPSASCKSSKKVKHCKATDTGIENAPHPTMLKHGSAVEVGIFTTGLRSRKMWVKGTIVGVLLLDKHLYAVEVDKQYPKPAVNANGHYFGKEVCKPKNPAYTVIVEQSDIRAMSSETKSGSLTGIQNPSYEEVSDESHNAASGNIKDNQTPTSFNSSKSKDTQNVSDEVSSHKHDKVEKGYEQQHAEGDVVCTAQKTMNQVVQDQPSSLMTSQMKENHFGTPSGKANSDRDPGKIRKPGNYFSNLIKTFTSGGNPPPFPLLPWHLDVISTGGSSLLDTLVKDLKINATVDKSLENVKKVEKLLQTWWIDETQEGYTMALKTLKDVLKRNGQAELVDFINGDNPEFGTFHHSVTEIVIHRVHKYLPVLANYLGESTESWSIPPSLFGESLFESWQQRHKGPEKLEILISGLQHVCCEMKKDRGQVTSCMYVEELAFDLEQGLPKNIIMDISSTVTVGEWRHLSFALGLTECRIAAFDNRFSLLRDKVFQMLRFWQMCQPYEVDQAEKLIIALQSCKCTEKVAVISRGLDEESLHKVAECIGERWKSLAGLVCAPPEIEYIRKKNESEKGKALLVLRRWKRKQPASSSDLKEKLAETLTECKLHKAARILCDGLDAITIYCLARKLAFDWQPLGIRLHQHLGKDKRENLGDPVQNALQMLKIWNMRKSDDPNRISILCHALADIGRRDTAEWLKKNIESDSEIEEGVKQLQLPSQAQEPEYKRVDKALLREVAEQLRRIKADITILKEFLNLTSEDDKYKPKNVTRESDLYLSVLLTWRHKMRTTDLEHKEIARFLDEALVKCGLPEVASCLSYGTPVDKMMKLHECGAVGGIDTKLETNLNVSSMVEVYWGDKLYHGIIQGIGVVEDLKDHGSIAAVEVEEPLIDLESNSYFEENICLTEAKAEYMKFSSDMRNMLFIPLKRCLPDGRFPTESQVMEEYQKVTDEDFGGIEWKPVEGYFPPPDGINANLIGLFKGIQGDHNSCYMDVTLYSMFAFSELFDDILKDTMHSGKLIQDIKKTLRENIVNPLRKNGVVSARPILAFRDLLNEYSNMKGLRTEEKDPEEFIHTLLQELLNAEPFLQISQGNGSTLKSFIYQIFLDKKEFLKLPTVEQLLHLSFLESDLKLMKVPECFIIQLPRFGKKFKLYDWIMPSFEMDITPLVQNSTRACTVCGKLAYFECKDCRPDEKFVEEIIQSFCRGCWDAKHHLTLRHQAKHLSYPKKFVDEYNRHTAMDFHPPPEDFHCQYIMELFAIMCIETSHYVAFVKAGKWKGSDWVFFDSMADRRGDHRGYNVPEVSHMADMMKTLSDSNILEKLEMPQFPRHWKRLMGDAYICFYRLVRKSDKESDGERENEADHRIPSNDAMSMESFADLSYSADLLLNTPIRKPTEELEVFPPNEPARTARRQTQSSFDGTHHSHEREIHQRREIPLTDIQSVMSDEVTNHDSEDAVNLPHSESHQFPSKDTSFHYANIGESTSIQSSSDGQDDSLSSSPRQSSQPQVQYHQKLHGITGTRV